jgi:hypothetical protein
MNDIEDWCGGLLQELFHLAQDKHGWKKKMKLILDLRSTRQILTVRSLRHIADM